MKLTGDNLQHAWFAMYELEEHLRQDVTEDQYPLRGQAMEKLRLARAVVSDFYTNFEEERCAENLKNKI